MSGVRPDVPPAVELLPPTAGLATVSGVKPDMLLTVLSAIVSGVKPDMLPAVALVRQRAGLAIVSGVKPDTLLAVRLAIVSGVKPDVRAADECGGDCSRGPCVAVVRVRIQDCSCPHRKPSILARRACPGKTKSRKPPGVVDGRSAVRRMEQDSSHCARVRRIWWAGETEDIAASVSSKKVHWLLPL